MSDTKTRSRWKRMLTMALKVYAGLCTLVVTACLAVLLLWGSWEATPSGELTAEDLKALGFTGVDLSNELLHQRLLRTNSQTGLGSTNASR